MLPDRVSNPGPLTYESGALPIALRGPAIMCVCAVFNETGWFTETMKQYQYQGFIKPALVSLVQDSYSGFNTRENLK